MIASDAIQRITADLDQRGGLTADRSISWLYGAPVIRRLIAVRRRCRRPGGTCGGLPASMFQSHAAHQGANRRSKSIVDVQLGQGIVVENEALVTPIPYRVSVATEDVHAQPPRSRSPWSITADNGSYVCSRQVGLD
jgi:hypothetical protein